MRDEEAPAGHKFLTPEQRLNIRISTMMPSISPVSDQWQRHFPLNFTDKIYLDPRLCSEFSPFLSSVMPAYVFNYPSFF